LPTNTSQDLAWRDYLRNPITWNFTKFLIDENGNLVAVFHNKVSPMSEEITKYLN
jgi:glutathione peroxidase